MRRLVVAIAVAALAGRAGAQAAPADEPRETPVLRTVGATSMGVGVALAFAAAGLLVYAKDAKDGFGAKSTHGDEWTPDDNRLWDKADRADKLGKIAAIAAGATFVTGVVLYVVGAPAGERAPQVTVAPVPGGAALGFACVF